MNNKHNFLCEGLLIPNFDKTDAIRGNMVSSHLQQFVVLKNPDFPKVFSGFENKIGSYSSAFKKADKNMKIIDVIKKNNYISLYIMEDDNNNVDVVEINKIVNITEKYGYMIENKIENKKINDTINKDELLYRASCYDDDMNLCIGKNLKAIYLAYKNMTYEDAIVISESAAKKLTSITVNDISISLNKNDLFCNLYNDINNEYGGYKMFPDVGERTIKNILTSKRRIDNIQALFNMTNRSLQVINFEDDTVYYVDGIISNIEIFSNCNIDELNKYDYNKQIVKYSKEMFKYYTLIYSALNKAINSEKVLSDDANFLFKKATNIKDIFLGKKKWVDNNGSDFENLIIKFTLYNEDSVIVGSKLTNRYGSKGCVSLILKDKDMPTTEDGEHADIVLNPLSIINRMNPSQLYEQEINALSNFIVKKINVEKKNIKKMKIFEEYLIIINKDEFKQIKKYYLSLNREERTDFWNDVEVNGIIVNIKPFYNDMNFNKLKFLYKKYNDYNPATFIGIERPLIFGDIYFLKLKHDPYGKLSVRSTGHLNIKNIPFKSTDYKKRTIMYQNTPIRMGEMEINNLNIAKNIKLIIYMLKSYSISDKNRSQLVEQILTGNIFNLNIKLDENVSNTKKILDVYLKTIGIKIE